MLGSGFDLVMRIRYTGAACGEMTKFAIVALGGGQGRCGWLEATVQDGCELQSGRGRQNETVAGLIAGRPTRANTPFRSTTNAQILSLPVVDTPRVITLSGLMSVD